MTGLIRFVVMVAICGTSLAGCSFFASKEPECKSIEEYQSSASLLPVTVPPGLNRPEETGALKIPAGPLPAEPLSDNAACLARPPDYFKKAPPPVKPAN